MEMLVALGIFAISVGLIADLFLSASRQQARIVVISRAQTDARLIIETIARELREGTLDFPRMSADTLALRGAGDEYVQVRRVVAGDATVSCPTGVPSCLAIGRGAAPDAIVWAPLTSSDVDATAFDFLATPTVDPTAWDADAGRYRSDEQPRVTIALTLTATGSRPGSRSTVEAQTTIVSRAYRR